jgi:hypothetical protein
VETVPNTGGVKSYRSRYAFTKTGELEKTTPLEPGEPIVLQAGIGSRTGRFTVGTGLLRLTDRRLFLLSHRPIGADWITEIPRPLIRGIKPVEVALPLGGGKRRAIGLDYEGGDGQGTAVFWAIKMGQLSLRSATHQWAAVEEGIARWTASLYDALIAALYPSLSTAAAEDRRPSGASDR